MTDNRFAPLALLAAGSFAAPATAATVQTFGYNPLTSESSFDVVIGGNDDAQFVYNYSNTEFVGPKAELQASAPGSAIGSSFSTFQLPNGTELYESQVKYTGPGDDQFVFLKFDVNGQKQLGTAHFLTDSTLDTITYEAAPGVPEPAVWAQLIAGFGFAGSALRVSRRRRQTVSAR